MPDLSSLVWMTSLQFLLYAIGWLLAAAMMPEHRRALTHWGAFMLLLGTGFALAAQRGEPRTWPAYVGGNLAFIASFIALRRGIEIFLRARVRDGEHLATAAVAIVALLALGPAAETAAWRVVMAYGMAAWIFGRMVVVGLAPLRAEVRPLMFGLIALPAVLLMLVAVERLLRQLLDMDTPIEMHRLDEGNRSILYGYLVGAAMFNFSFTALLVRRLLLNLRQLSRSDPLTGLLNRRALQLQLQQTVGRAQRSGRTFAVLALDLDHFKEVNDHHGHPAGDAVLVQVAQRLTAVARQGDTLARTGGEEFIVLMPDTDAQGAMRAAERMRQSVAREPFGVEGPPVPLAVTVSIGVTVAEPGEADHHSLMQRADRALYRAKREGRNRIVI